MEIKAFPKICALGTRYVESIFQDHVEVTEKIDGSQFVFGWDSDGQYHCRSKGKVMFADAPEKMFAEGVAYTSSLEPVRDHAFYCEYLQRPKHNTLAYSRIPKNHLMLFGVADFQREFFHGDYDSLVAWSGKLDIECVPIISSGPSSPAEILALFDEELESKLGGCPAEGVVIKNYDRGMNYGEKAYPIMTAKFVTEKFKEKHSKNQEYTPRRDKWEAYKDTFRTEARWMKAVQYLRDCGELQGEPRDIGALIKRVHQDVMEEEQDDIKQWLWLQFGPEVGRKAVAGLPEWYKEWLVNGQQA